MKQRHDGLEQVQCVFGKFVHGKEEVTLFSPSVIILVDYDMWKQINRNATSIIESSAQAGHKADPRAHYGSQWSCVASTRTKIRPYHLFVQSSVTPGK